MSEVTHLVPLRERPLHERVAATVRAEMARYGVRQREIAVALGLTQQSVSGKLRGSTPFAVDELAVVAPMVGMTVSELIAQGEGPRPGVSQSEGLRGRPRHDSNVQPTGLTAEGQEDGTGRLASVHPLTPRPRIRHLAGTASAVVIPLRRRSA